MAEPSSYASLPLNVKLAVLQACADASSSVGGEGGHLRLARVDREHRALGQDDAVWISWLKKKYQLDVRKAAGRQDLSVAREGVARSVCQTISEQLRRTTHTPAQPVADHPGVAQQLQLQGQPVELQLVRFCAVYTDGGASDIMMPDGTGDVWADKAFRCMPNGAFCTLASTNCNLLALLQDIMPAPPRAPPSPDPSAAPPAAPNPTAPATVNQTHPAPEPPPPPPPPPSTTVGPLHNAAGHLVAVQALHQMFGAQPLLPAPLHLAAAPAPQQRLQQQQQGAASHQPLKYLADSEQQRRQELCYDPSGLLIHDRSQARRLEGADGGPAQAQASRTGSRDHLQHLAQAPVPPASSSASGQPPQHPHASQQQPGSGNVLSWHWLPSAPPQEQQPLPLSSCVAVIDALTACRFGNLTCPIRVGAMLTGCVTPETPTPRQWWQAGGAAGPHSTGQREAPEDAALGMLPAISSVVLSSPRHPSEALARASNGDGSAAASPVHSPWLAGAAVAPPSSLPALALGAPRPGPSVVAAAGARPRARGAGTGLSLGWEGQSRAGTPLGLHVEPPSEDELRTSYLKGVATQPSSAALNGLTSVPAVVAAVRRGRLPRILHHTLLPHGEFIEFEPGTAAAPSLPPAPSPAPGACGGGGGSSHSSSSDGSGSKPPSSSSSGGDEAGGSAFVPGRAMPPPPLLPPRHGAVCEATADVPHKAPAVALHPVLWFRFFVHAEVQDVQTAHLLSFHMNLTRTSNASQLTWGCPPPAMLAHFAPLYEEVLQDFHAPPQQGPVGAASSSAQAGQRQQVAMALVCMGEQGQLTSVPVDAACMAHPPSLCQYAWGHELLIMAQQARAAAARDGQDSWPLDSWPHTPPPFQGLLHQPLMEQDLDSREQLGHLDEPLRGLAQTQPEPPAPDLAGHPHQPGAPFGQQLRDGAGKDVVLLSDPLSDMAVDGNCPWDGIPALHGEAAPVGPCACSAGGKRQGGALPSLQPLQPLQPVPKVPVQVAAPYVPAHGRVRDVLTGVVVAGGEDAEDDEHAAELDLLRCRLRCPRAANMLCIKLINSDDLREELEDLDELERELQNQDLTWMALRGVALALPPELRLSASTASLALPAA